MGNNILKDEVITATVTAYLRCGKSIRKASKKLGISRHTVKARLQRGQERGLFSGNIQGKTHEVEESIKKDFNYKKDRGVITTKSLHIQTIPEAAEAAALDLEEWEVERGKVNSWEVTMGADKTLTGKAETYTNFQVTLWIKRKITEPIVTAIEALVKTIPTFKPVGPKPIHFTKGEYLQEMALFDIHFGKLAWGKETGQGDYDVNIAEDWFIQAAEKNLNYGESFPRAKILYILGQDYLHVENYMNQTPLGGNNLDVDTRLPKIFEVAMGAAIKVIYMCREVAPVEILWVPGNHDMHASYYLSHILKAHFRDDKYVTINNGPKWEKAILWGNLLVGYTHDAERRQTAAINMLPQMFPELWGKSKYRELHTGHLHKKGETKYKPVQTVGGTVIRRLPTLSVIDKWHSDGRFIDAVPGGESMIWSKSNGVVAHYTAYVQ
jgi:hypothetical protein